MKPLKHKHSIEIEQGSNDSGVEPPKELSPEGRGWTAPSRDGREEATMEKVKVLLLAVTSYVS